MTYQRQAGNRTRLAPVLHLESLTEIQSVPLARVKTVITGIRLFSSLLFWRCFQPNPFSFFLLAFWRQSILNLPSLQLQGKVFNTPCEVASHELTQMWQSVLIIINVAAWCYIVKAFRIGSKELLLSDFFSSQVFDRSENTDGLVVDFQHLMCILEHSWFWEMPFPFCVGNKIKLV